MPLLYWQKYSLNLSKFSSWISRLLNANKMLNYNVSVVHSKDAMMSAVTLSNTHIRAIAHLISNNQLPTPLLLSDVSSPK